MTGADRNGLVVSFVRDVMTAPVLTVSPDTPRAKIRRLMHHYTIRHLPVVDENRLVGMVSDRDVQGTTGTVTATARRMMTPEVVTVTPDTRVEHAARLMLERRFGALPVMDGAALVGIVSYTDLLRAFILLLDTATAERIAVDWTSAA